MNIQQLDITWSRGQGRPPGRCGFYTETWTIHMSAPRWGEQCLRRGNSKFKGIEMPKNGWCLKWKRERVEWREVEKSRWVSYRFLSHSGILYLALRAKQRHWGILSYDSDLHFWRLTLTTVTGRDEDWKQGEPQRVSFNKPGKRWWHGLKQWLWKED